MVFAACTAKRACLCASAGLCCLASHCFGPVDALLSHALPPRPPRRQPITARWPAGALAHRHGTRHHPFRGYPTLPVGVSVCACRRSPPCPDACTPRTAALPASNTPLSVDAIHTSTNNGHQTLSRGCRGLPVLCKRLAHAYVVSASCMRGILLTLLPAFHAVKSARERLEKAGFTQIKVCFTLCIVHMVQMAACVGAAWLWPRLSSK